MKATVAELTQFFTRKPQAGIGLLIFSACLFVYLANVQFISSNDSVPNTLLAFHWLENHTLHLDAFRGGHYYHPNDLFGPNGIPYFFAEAPNGHLTSAYPIGTAIVSFPLYFVFFLYLKFMAFLQSGFSDSAALSISVTDASFEAQRQQFEKLAGSILTALATVIFYFTVRLKFSTAVALISSFIYAFATLNWVVSSQGLWPHTVSNLALISIIFCLFKAHRSEGSRRKLLLVTAGFFCGLMPGIRPTSLLFAATVIAYGALTYRRDVIFLLLGASSALLNAAWNIYFFGFSLRSLLVGGYSRLLGTSSGSYNFGDWTYSQEAFWGLLFSPSRGIFVFSPVLLFAIPGIRQVFRRKVDPDERLLAWLTVASLILFIHYCFFIPWWGAITYGTRFLVDVLPVICLLISYFIARLLTANWQQSPWALSAVATVFGGVVAFSTFTQIVGAFSDTHHWDTSPTSHLTRFWDWRDSQIERHARNLYMRIHPPIDQPRPYLNRLNGKILRLEDSNGQPLSEPLTVQPLQEQVLQVRLRNIGRSPWYGYDTGLIRGRTIVKVRFLDQANQEVPLALRNFLFVEGSPSRGETATAIGSVLFPQKPGEYTMVFDLAAERLGPSKRPATQSAFPFKVIVQPAPAP